MNQHTRVAWLLCLCIYGLTTNAQNQLYLEQYSSRDGDPSFHSSYQSFQSFQNSLMQSLSFSFLIGEKKYDVLVDQQFETAIPYYTWHQGRLIFETELDFRIIVGKSQKDEQIVIVEQEDKFQLTIENNGFTRNLTLESVSGDKAHFKQTISRNKQRHFTCDHHSSNPPIQRRDRNEFNDNCIVNEVAIIIDSEYYKMHGGASETQIFSIAHTMMGMYADETDLRMRLSALIGFPNGDPYVIKPDMEGHINPTELLHSFNTWADYIDYDIKALLSGFDFGGSIIGKAFVGTSCDTSKNVCIVQGRQFELTFNASILAHEIGHIYGLRHDTGSDNECPETGYIMNQKIDRLNPSTSFSSCSQNGLNSFYNSDASGCMNRLDCSDAQNFVLPIELLSFDAKSENRIIRTHWETSYEWQSSHFRLEYSTNGVDFYPQALIEANGVPSRYEHSFLALDQLVYLRLKMVDIDGAYDYSNIVSIAVPMQEGVVFPNPVKSGQNARLISAFDLGQVWVVDGLGRTVWTGFVADNSLTLPSLASGIYLIKGTSLQHKLIVE